MEKYFEIKKGSSLYESYFLWVEDYKKVGKAFKTIKEDFGIETNEFYARKDTFHIVPTDNDWQNFKDQMTKSDYGVFKKNTPITKAWLALVQDIQYMDKPRLFYYMHFYGRWSEQMFHDGDKLYGCMKTKNDSEFKLPDFCIPMKASEYYQVLEKLEEKEQAEREER